LFLSLEKKETSSQPQNEVYARLLLDIVVRQSSVILKLLARKNKPLLIGRDAFAILNLGLYISNSVA
jgi:hypothetical protein